MCFSRVGWEGLTPPEPQVLRGKKRILSPNKLKGPVSEGGADAEPSKATTAPYRSQLIFLRPLC